MLWLSSRFAVAVFLLVVIGFLPSCSKKKKRPPPSGPSPSGKVEAPKSIRPHLHTARGLLAEVMRAEGNVGGLLIDLGTADAHKYTRGGWLNGWGENRRHADGTTYLPATSRSVPLHVLLSGEPVQEVVARLRLPAGAQRVAFLVDGASIGNALVGSTWSVVRIPVPSGSIKPGHHELRFLFPGSPKGKPNAEADWVWLSTTRGATPPLLTPRAMPLRIGSLTRRALVSPTSRTYRFYLHVPAAATFVFDYGAKVKATFAVAVASDDGSTRELWRQAATLNQWREAHVDLKAFAGQPVRLDLRTDGGPGVIAWGEPQLMVKPRGGPASLPATARPRPRNLVMILIDTARADVYRPVNAATKVTTPAYNALAEESTLFINAYNNENWTKPSVATILTGLYPTTHGAKDESERLSEEATLLSERLRLAKFDTAGFIANGHISDKFGFKRGWNHYVNYIREEKSSAAQEVYGDALKWLEARREAGKTSRFFLYLQTIDPHVPYRQHAKHTPRYHPDPYDGPLGPMVDGHEQAAISKGKIKADDADYAWIQALYHGEISYHDEHMGKFLGQLKEMKLLDDTLLVVLNDHGEELNEHGRLGHGHSLYEELIRNPLLMRFPPAVPRGHVVEQVTETVDVTPTVLDLLGLPPARGLDGLSLMPRINGRSEPKPLYAVSEFLDGRRSIRIGRLKLVVSPGKELRLYDLDRDPGEEHNRADSLPVARRLGEVYLAEALATPTKAERHRDLTARRRLRGGKVKLDRRLKKQLRAMGYLAK